MDISARSSRKKKKKLSIFQVVFLVNVQCCVRVSASNFQVLTRNSGGATAFGNIARFLAGPARRIEVFFFGTNCLELRSGE